MRKWFPSTATLYVVLQYLSYVAVGFALMAMHQRNPALAAAFWACAVWARMERMVITYDRVHRLFDVPTTPQEPNT